MKKQLFSLAALALVSGVVQAQSSVTLYGTLDGSLQYINNANAAKQSLNLGYVDSAVSSSVWGLRGAEDLGGGMKATFQLEGDIQTNNGGLNNNGLFRRAANVGIGGSFGQFDFGLKANPLMATHNALMPVAGNSVAASAAYAVGYKDDYTKNAVTYTSPSLAGLVLQGQVGLGNTVAETTAGSVYAGSLVYTGIKNLTVRGAIQRRLKATSSSAANAKANSPSSTNLADPNVFFTTPDVDKTSYLAGLSYKIDNLTLALAWLHNQTAGKPQVNATQIGLGYQATPKILLGVSYAASTFGSNLINTQARYSLSKRTTVYGQIGLASNANNSNGIFSPLFASTGLQPAADISTGANKYWDSKGNANMTQTAVGLGVIHTF